MKTYAVYQRYQYRVIITKHMRMFYFRLLKDISIRLRNKNSRINITIRSMNFTMSPYENSAGNMKFTLTTSRESLFDSYFFLRDICVYCITGRFTRFILSIAIALFVS